MPACTVNYEVDYSKSPPSSCHERSHCNMVSMKKVHVHDAAEKASVCSLKTDSNSVRQMKELFSIYTAFLSLCIFIMKCAQKCFHNSVFSILSWICSLLPVFLLQWVQPAPLCVERRTRLKYSRACWTASQLKVSPSHLASKRLSQPQI